jgi:7,8-dihydropterin-6-yl-methyl-4-(beta-D-ribofuranosyl)aminobenzene 5'-phosphate synthase
MQIPVLKSMTVEVLVDNFYDVFEPSRPGVVERVVPGRLKKPLVAAHGLAFWITVQNNGERRQILMDAANSPLPLMNNIEALEHNLDEVDALVLSHGHPDHYGGLMEILKRRQGKLSIYFHRDCCLPKLLITPKGRIGPWKLEREVLLQVGAEVHENTGPALVLNQVLLTGTVEASTPYETPLPGPKRVIAGAEENDPFTDEQAFVAHVEGQGLVILGGCSHPGIVNMVKYAQKLTGVKEIAALIAPASGL